MTTHHSDLARESKATIAFILRNGPLEDLHAGKTCPICQGKQEYSHVTDDEMRHIMKTAVNRDYKLRVLKKKNPQRYEEEIAFGELYTKQWDDPEEPSSPLKNTLAGTRGGT